MLIISLKNIDEEPFLQIIDQGFSSEIVYTVRMRKKKISGGLPITGGRINIRIVKKASKEYLTSMYLIENGGKTTAYEATPDFTADFFSCRTAIPFEYFTSSEYLIEARARADLIKRPAPLSLLDPFLTSEITVTPWVSLGD